MSQRYPLGYEKLTSLSSARELQSIPEGATHAIIQAIDQNVRWTDHADDTPTASNGMQLAVGRDMLYDGKLSELKFIEETATAYINIAYYKFK